MSSQLTELQVLPDDIEVSETVVNRAMDVRSASMIFLATNIRRDATPFGGIGKMLSFRLWFDLS